MSVDDARQHQPPDPFSLATSAAAAIADATGRGSHDVAVVLGSGWHDVVGDLGDSVVDISSATLPGFVTPTVPGHGGVVRSAEVGGRPVLFLVGRAHLYEGHPAPLVVHPVRTAVFAGARTIVLTNAAGSLDPGYSPGQVVLIRDHLNLTGASPLGGPAPPQQYGSRFVDLSAVYPEKLRVKARAIDPSLTDGVYAGVQGPHYETPAEVAMLRLFGADLVGMSTVLEAIAAHHLGAEVLGISLVTNLAAGLGPGPLNHLEVLALGAVAAPALSKLLAGVLRRL